MSNTNTTNANTVNNLNIFTFIKDIYQSLKHIDKTLNISNDELNKKISKLEENQQILIDKMTNIELVLLKLSETNKPNTGLNKDIEFELLEKMKKLNQNDINNSKLVLKPNELTFSNILENNYSFNDINQSLGHNVNNINNMNIVDNIDIVDTLENDNNYMFLDNISETSINNTNNNTNKEESLDTLLF